MSTISLLISAGRSVSEAYPVAVTTADDRLRYRLLTGPDDRSFCERISAALDEGYVLYGSPSITHTSDGVIAAQAVVLPNT